MCQAFEQANFELLLDIMSYGPALALPNKDKPFTIFCEAREGGVGSIYNIWAAYGSLVVQNKYNT